MRALFGILALSLSLVAPSPLRAAEAAAEVDPTVWGPYGVGVTTLTFYDASRDDREITTEVWYPAIQPVDAPGDYYYHLGWGQATREAVPVLGERFPLVAFSHGNGGTRFQSIFYCEHLASHGYVVVAPDHLGNTFYGWDDALTQRSAVDRPLDISYVITQMLRLSRVGQEPVPGTLDPERIGMTGHSFGGFTTLVIAGAQLDMDAARAACAGGDDLACGAVDYAEELFGAGLDWLDLSDPRVSVAIPQTPGIYDYFGDEGLSTIFTATAEMASLDDGILPYDEEAAPIYQALPGPKAFMTLNFRGHYAYSSIWDVRPFARTCDSYADCPDRDPSHEVVNTLATAFLGTYLKGEAAWAPWLDGAYYAREYPVTVDYESSGLR